MNQVVIELDHNGMAELLKSDGLRSVLETEARKRNPGSGYSVKTYNAGSRVVAKIQADTADAVRDNLKNNTLLKALGRNK